MLPVSAQSAPPLPARIQITQAPESSVRRIALVLLFGYIATVFSRMPEFLGEKGVSSFHLPAILISVIFLVTLTACRPAEIFSSRANVLLLAFTAWIVICIPVSSYRGGSVEMLTHYWLPNIMLSLGIAALPKDVRECRSVMLSFCAGMGLIIVTYLASGRDVQGRLTGGAGTLGNSNLFAMQLEMGLPFLAVPLIGRRKVSFSSVLAMAVMLVSAVLVLMTGSRSGLVALCLMAFLYFLTATPFGKLRVGILAILAGAATLLFLPSTLVQRYATIFSNDVETTSEAQQSTIQRMKQLDQSWRLTLDNPFFGVGPGVFVVAAAEESKQRNERASWLETHNSYTQVSSETGFPGFFLYLALIAAWILPALKLFRSVRKKKEHRELKLLLLCLLLAFVGTLVNMGFSSNAYLLYLPALGGLAVALVRCGRAQLAVAPAGAVMAPAFGVPRTTPSSLPRTDPPARPSNPIRFGGPRVRPPGQ